MLYLNLYLAISLISCAAYCIFRSMQNKRRLKVIRSLQKFMLVKVKINNQLSLAKIINKYDTIAFCFLIEKNKYTYINLENIYPYDY